MTQSLKATTESMTGVRVLDELNEIRHQLAIVSAAIHGTTEEVLSGDLSSGLGALVWDLEGRLVTVRDAVEAEQRTSRAAAPPAEPRLSKAGKAKLKRRLAGIDRQIKRALVESGGKPTTRRRRSNTKRTR